MTRNAVRRADGTVSARQWAGVHSRAESPGVLPYAITRRFGDHRILRSVLALRFPPGSRRDPPALWLSLEGRFDLPALRDGLTAAGIDFDLIEDGAAVRVSLRADGELIVRRGRAVVRLGYPESFEPLGAEDAGTLAESLPDRAIAWRLTGELPGYLTGDFELPRPIHAGLDLPYRDAAPALVLEARFASENVAIALAGQLRGLARRLEQQVDDGELPASLLSILTGLEVTPDGRSATARVPLADVDLDVLVEDLIDALL